MSDSNTPITDEESCDLRGTCDGGWVPADVSRTLERELTEARRELGKCAKHVSFGTNESLCAQLTAHKEALNVCQMALCADTHELFVELRHEALAAIAKCKEQNK